MKTKITACLLTATLASACAARSREETLDGDWAYVDASGTQGYGLTVAGDQYVATSVRLTSPTAAQAQAEAGAFTVDGDEILTSPRRDTCGGSAKPDAIRFRLDDGALTLGFASGLIVVMRRSDAAPGASNEAIQLGCFKGGGFTPGPLADVRR